MYTFKVTISRSVDIDIYPSVDILPNGRYVVYLPNGRFLILILCFLQTSRDPIPVLITPFRIFCYSPSMYAYLLLQFLFVSVVIANFKKSPDRNNINRGVEHLTIGKYRQITNGTLSLQNVYIFLNIFVFINISSHQCNLWNIQICGSSITK